MIAVLHTAGDLLHFHPHIHAMALDGTVDGNGTFQQLAKVDLEVLHDYFQQDIFKALLKQELITEEIAESMLSWEHSGFNVWSGEPFTDPNTRLFLGRYLKKSPISLERMSIDNNGSVVITRKGDDFNETRSFDPLEFLAELTSHIPNIWEQTTRYYGVFAARTRGATVTKVATPLPDPPVPKPAVSKYWATWIKKIYNVDPLECPKCGGQMKVVAFIHDPREIAAIAKNRGIQPYRAPPPLRSVSLPEPTVVPVWD